MKAPQAKVENPQKESELATITLTQEAEERLKIQIATVSTRSVRETRNYNGEVVVPPDSINTVNAPITGTLSGAKRASGMAVTKGQTVFRILPLISPAEREQLELVERDAKIAAVVARNDIESSKTKVNAAKLRVARAERLVKDGGGSEKAAEQMREELKLAEIALQGAQQRLEEIRNLPAQVNDPVDVRSPQSGVIQRLSVTAGQTVAAGTMLFEIASYDSVLIRVPVYVGELKLIEQGAAARVHGLNDPADSGRYAQPAAAPPSADPNSATADLYFELSNGDGALRPGQRVGVTLPIRASVDNSLIIPWSAVIHDLEGGTWVYEQISPLHYVRRRIAVDHVIDDTAVLGSGPAVGAKIVSAGASELFGVEFGVGK